MATPCQVWWPRSRWMCIGPEASALLQVHGPQSAVHRPVARFALAPNQSWTVLKREEPPSAAFLPLKFPPVASPLDLIERRFHPRPRLRPRHKAMHRGSPRAGHASVRFLPGSKRAPYSALPVESAVEQLLRATGHTSAPIGLLPR